jgi:hypothetical protein
MQTELTEAWLSILSGLGPHELRHQAPRRHFPFGIVLWSEQSDTALRRLAQVVLLSLNDQTHTVVRPFKLYLQFVTAGIDNGVADCLSFREPRGRKGTVLEAPVVCSTDY